jgi:hypothetical protein
MDPFGRSRMPLATRRVAPASRSVRGHRVAFGNRREGSIHVDGSQLRRHERHGLTRRTRVGSNRGGMNRMKKKEGCS